ncbi:hypothetical protein [Methylocystis echinoides]|uniref:Uncharacterized protein n=1 Tax=Methylocystis echinoides TaxID=29468 RepID=A0A9W6GUN9_9HYPH|nr:hypothetical protein [Methylocystis echinoides]GLI93195.1 hypothetical protein LMG27198_21870 [Methylocystis echinoides]
MADKIIEMRRLSDDAVYRFLPQQPADGFPRYRRADKDIWILRHPDFGWIVWDAGEGALMGRPWEVALKDQGATPPESVWVSRKDANAFVYRLVVVAD